jgi:sucrose-6-phosphate hydrolase SacC (GH32 family)
MKRLILLNILLLMIGIQLLSQNKPADVPILIKDGKEVPQEAILATRELRNRLLSDHYRPAFHFCIQEGNGRPGDPNGLLYYEREYHMFYQHNPFEREWKNSWGYAVSKDLVHWEELPVVMLPDTLGTIFSGTAVIDYKNTSGFGKDSIPPLVAIYTANSQGNERC